MSDFSSSLNMAGLLLVAKQLAEFDMKEKANEERTKLLLRCEIRGEVENPISNTSGFCDFDMTDMISILSNRPNSTPKNISDVASSNSAHSDLENDMIEPDYGSDLPGPSRPNFDDLDENAEFWQVNEQWDHRLVYPDYRCHQCEGHHWIKNCPWNFGRVETTKYQGSRQSQGWFRCSYCKQKWKSQKVWANTSQICRRCRNEVYPYRMKPLLKDSTKI
ncbi:unnamed protein product, partial [Mesorhabditis belari]|uniref:3CxxC-type domain-containing protein n=1 Tax=Mesorhabditis belari TaxID=2138241 RepID=A0AAF3FRW0_9BILA